MDLIHYSGLILGAIIAFFAVTQLAVMAKSIRKEGVTVTTGTWLRGFWNTLINEVFIQKNFGQCEDKNRYWAHLALFWGFSGLLVATALAFSIDTFVSVQSSLKAIPGIIGIIAGLVLLYGSGYYIYRRFAVKDSYSKFSRHDDWVFLWLMFLAGLTGFLLDIFMWANLPWPAYITFATHLVVVFDLLLTAPFTKFAHAIYRPLAIWMSAAYQSQGEAIQA